MNQYSPSINKIVSDALYSTFAWMSFGLFITAMVAYVASQTKFMFYFLHASVYGALFQAVIFGSQIGIIIAIVLLMKKASYTTLRALYLAFTGCTGLSLSVIFMLYEFKSIIGIFLITSGMFLSLWLYGATTKRDLSPFKSFFIMLLTGVIIFSLLNSFFFKGIMFQRMLSLISIIIFSFLTAADIQTLKKTLAEFAYDNENQKKLGLLGALTMYQNFINLFLNLLSLFGEQKKK
jgi:FtsH-binding integral membrane protein